MACPNELLQLVDSWWRRFQRRCWTVSCLFVLDLSIACSRGQYVLCFACLLGCGAAPRGGIARLVTVWLDTSSRRGIVCLVPPRCLGCADAPHVWPLTMARMNVSLATYGLVNELVQLCHG